LLLGESEQKTRSSQKVERCVHTAKNEANEQMST
jgi:hypothetical protein